MTPLLPACLRAQPRRRSAVRLPPLAFPLSSQITSLTTPSWPSRASAQPALRHRLFLYLSGRRRPYASKSTVRDRHRRRAHPSPPPPPQRAHRRDPAAERQQEGPPRRRWHSIMPPQPSLARPGHTCHHILSSPRRCQPRLCTGAPPGFRRPALPSRRASASD